MDTNSMNYVVKKLKYIYKTFDRRTFHCNFQTGHYKSTRCI